MNLITFILIVVFCYPIVKGFLLKFSSENLKYDIEEIGKSISFILGIIIGVSFGKKVFFEHETSIYLNLYNYIPKNIMQYLEKNTLIIYAIIIPLIVFIVYRIIFFVFEIFNRITLYAIIDVIGKKIKGKSTFVQRLIGSAFEMPKAICYVILLSFILNTVAIFNLGGGNFNSYLQNSKAYNILCEQVVIPISNTTLARNLPKIINNSFRIVVKENNVKDDGKSASSKGNSVENKKVVVYYNGVTLEEGIKSNTEIEGFAKSIVENSNSVLDKSKSIYKWVGSNISYDENKATAVLNNNFDVKSGAIETFKTKKGICFDYACLYVAMCRANNIKVRLVTGEGFNGASWVSHAWNQVYIPSLDKWINVDSTFYKGGNYFNSKKFDIDHRDSNVVGEW